MIYRLGDVQLCCIQEASRNLRKGCYRYGRAVDGSVGTAKVRRDRCWTGKELQIERGVVKIFMLPSSLILSSSFHPLHQLTGLLFSQATLIRTTIDLQAPSPVGPALSSVAFGMANLLMIIRPTTSLGPFISTARSHRSHSTTPVQQYEGIWPSIVSFQLCYFVMSFSPPLTICPFS
jgi:hypothetical protein